MGKLTKRDYESLANVVIECYPLTQEEDPDAASEPQASAYDQWSKMREALAEFFEPFENFKKDNWLARTDCAKRDRITRSLMRHPAGGTEERGM